VGGAINLLFIKIYQLQKSEDMLMIENDRLK